MIGKTISHYRVDARLGGGGMGVVYRAQDTRLGRDVALKLLPQELAGDEVALERFRREARAVSALNHPNICTLHDLGEHDGQPFLVMELLEGRTLREAIGADPMDPATVIKLGSQMADALDAAHGAGILHRDLKPANLFLTSRGDIKILDFGLAKQDEEDSEDAPTQLAVAELTDAGSAVGTVAYMSPEQARGEGLDSRSDLFSLGVVLYEMLTATRAFSGTTSAVIFDGILHKTPTAPVRLNPDTPAELEAILARLLEKDRELRFQSAADLRAAMDRLGRDATSTQTGLAASRSAAGFATADTGSDAPSSDAAIAAELAKRNRGKLLAVGLGLVLLVVAGVFGLSRMGGGHVDESIRSLAVLPFEVQGSGEEMALLGDGISEGLINHIASMPEMRVVSRNSAFRFRDSVDLAEVARELSVQAVITGRISKQSDQYVVQADLVDARTDSQLWGRQFTAGSDLFSVQEQIARAVAQQLGIQIGDEQAQRLAEKPTQSSEAYQLYLKGRLHWDRRTPEDVRKGLDYFQQALDIDPTYALAWSGVADSYLVGSGSYLDVPFQEAHKRAKAAASKARELDPELAEAWVTLADVATYQYRLDEAESGFKRAIELNPNYATAYQWYSELQVVTGDLEGAVASMEKARSLDPLSAIHHQSAAVAYFYAGRLTDALREARLAKGKGLAFGELFEAHILLFEGHEDFVVPLTNWLEFIGETQARAALLAAYEKDGVAGFRRTARLQLDRDDVDRFPPEVLVFECEDGDEDRALDHYAHHLEIGSADAIRIRYWPLANCLREHPRFNELQVKYGLPPVPPDFRTPPDPAAR